MESGTITDNTARGLGIEGGGGVDVANGGNFTMRSGAISENRVQDSGGGIFVYHAGTISISNADIRNNTANNGGGGVGGFNTDITIQDSCIRDNWALWGGGVYFNGNTKNFNMTGGEILDNTTAPPPPGVTGGVHLSSGTTLTMAGTAMIGQDNPVYFASNTVRLIIGGTLTTQFQAANIVGVSSGQTILAGSLSSSNCSKFLVKGEYSKINTSGVYVP
jgi:hypothetical protein